MSGPRKLNKDWPQSGFNHFPCPRCNIQRTKGEENDLMLLIPSDMMHELDHEIPDNGLMLVLCYPCAVEVLGSIGTKIALSKVFAFAHTLGSRGSVKLP